MSYTLVCKKCQIKGIEDVTVDYSKEDRLVTCPRCKTNYSVISRTVHSIKAAYTNGVKYRYVLTTNEEDGFTRIRRIVGPSGIAIRSGDEISIVSHNGRKIGIADHRNNIWYPLHVPTKIRGMDLVAFAVMEFSLVLAAIYFAFIGTNAVKTIVSSPVIILFIISLMLLVASGPMLQKLAVRPIEETDTGWDN